MDFIKYIFRDKLSVRQRWGLAKFWVTRKSWEGVAATLSVNGWVGVGKFSFRTNMWGGVAGELSLRFSSLPLNYTTQSIVLRSTHVT